MRRLAFHALLAVSGCTGTLDLPWADTGAVGAIPFPRAPGGLATPTPASTPFVPGTLPDDFGDGHSGDMTATGPVTVNPCAALANATAGATDIASPPPPGAAAGDRVLLWQVQDTFAIQGDTGTVTAPGGAGLFEFARLATVTGSTFTLTLPLANGYSSGATRRAQVCTIPEFQNASVFNGGALSGTPWNGETGGLVALFAQNLAIDGPVTADGIGFRGGEESSGEDGGEDRVALETDADAGGGKAEGLDRSGYGRFGRGNFANAAGGGNSRNGGGGGGGNRGSGGIGGRQNTLMGIVDDTRGLPGTAVVTSDLRFVMGGGGGGGHQNDGLQADGGNGGGLVLLFAQNLLLGSNGSIRADGAPGIGNGAGGTGDGGGGGGAGGMIVVVLENDTFSAGTIRARGGDGGNLNDSTDTQGPGGGGGGGVFLGNFQNLVGAAVTAGGDRGLNFGGDPNGAENGANGVSELTP